MASPETVNLLAKILEGGKAVGGDLMKWDPCNKRFFQWALVIGLAVGVVGPHDGAMAAPEPPKVRLLQEVYDLIKDRYVDEKKTQDDDLYEGAIRGMVDTLDRHSDYLDPESRKELNIETSGSFGGLGIEISMEKGRLVVVTPIEDTPAYRAGIQSGDFISAINGESTEEWSLDKAIVKLRGTVGTEVTLTIVREALDEPFDLKMKRDIIKIHTVKGYLLREGVAYIRLRNFAETTAEDFKKSLKEMMDRGATSLILDLRNNPGGLLTSAVDVASQFVPAGKPIVSTKGRMPQMNSELLSTGGLLVEASFPIMVLVNKGSASASEIVTGALKDYQRGTVVGSKTFGKGSVQSVFELPGGAGLKLTTAYYYTPAGTLIHDKGIEPHAAVAEDIGGRMLMDLYRKEAFTAFSGRYVKNHAALPEAFEVQDGIWREFMEFAREQGSAYTEEEMIKDRKLAKRQLKFEIIRKGRGRDAAELSALREDDDVVKRAVDLIRAKQEQDKLKK